MDPKGDTYRRCTFEPQPRNKRNRASHNQSQLLSRRTSRQHSNNLSELSEIDNTPTLRMKRDSLE